jgi:hypothetical protein
MAAVGIGAEYGVRIYEYMVDPQYGVRIYEYMVDRVHGRSSTC